MSLTRTLKFITSHPLNKGHKGRALTRYLRWQIGSRLVPGPVAISWIDDARVIVRPGETGMTQNIYCGLAEFADMAFLLHSMTPDDLFVDVGANVGSYTVLACAARGARGFCFEPVPTTYLRLLDNLRINNVLHHVSALNIGVSDKEGELTFTAGNDTTNHVLIGGETEEGAIKVPVRTLDSVVEGEQPFFMKIDVEGFETPVLAGARGTLANPALHAVLIELNGSGTRYGYDEGAILHTMKDLGFGTYSYEPFARELRSLQGKNTVTDNTLFVRDESVVRDRLRNAKRVSWGNKEF